MSAHAPDENPSSARRSLEEAIQSEITLGQKDPLTISRHVIERWPEEWLQEELMAFAEDIIADIARQRLNAQRRAEVVKLQPSSTRSEVQVRLSSVFIPDVGWKRVDDLTQDDLKARVDYMRKIAASVDRQARFFQNLLDALVAAGASTVGDLPQLPSFDAKELEE